MFLIDIERIYIKELRNKIFYKLNGVPLNTVWVNAFKKEMADKIVQDMGEILLAHSGIIMNFADKPGNSIFRAVKIVN